MNEDSIDDLIARTLTAAALLHSVAEECEGLRDHPSFAHLDGQVLLNLLWASKNNALREADDCARYLRGCKEELSKSEAEK